MSGLRLSADNTLERCYGYARDQSAAAVTGLAGKWLSAMAWGLGAKGPQ